MKTLYLECNMGIAGDMLMASLFELVDDKMKVLDNINSLGLPHTSISFENKMTNGVSGAHAVVICDGVEEGEYNYHHTHNTPFDIKQIINSLNINDKVKSKALLTYDYIAQAEAKVHNTTMDNIHFHEVGTLDAIADTVVCSYLIDYLKIDRVICSPINVGNGTVKCAHGILPVPAPATAELLSDIPYYKSDIQCELCTPTGAALVKTFVDEFGNQPVMVNTNIGYGVGTKELSVANCVRAIFGECENSTIELATNIDDMTPEELAYACEVLLNNGALDVYQTPITMKKSRLGVMLSVICKQEDKQKMLELIFKHTSTIGVREYKLERSTLNRKFDVINTPYGQISKKQSAGYGVDKSKLEFEDMKKIANANDMSLDDVKNMVNEQYI